MADETTTANSGDEQEAGSAAADTSGTEQRTFTQADLDRLIDARMAKERQRAEVAVKRAQDEAARKQAEEQGKFQELYTKAQRDLEQLAAEKRTLELAGLRQSVAIRLGVPAVFADRLRGDDEAAIEADAKTLLAGLPKQSLPTANAGAGAKSPGVNDSKNMNAFIRAAAGRTQ